MDWILRSPQVHSTLGNLGTFRGEKYQPNENCNVYLQSVLQDLIHDDKNVFSCRRSIHFSRSISKNLIPILENTKDDKTIELLLKILIHLTIPVNCLISESNARSDIGRQIDFDLNSLLSSAKLAFTENEATKAVIGFLKRNIPNQNQTKLFPQQCTNINSSLILLINILNIHDCVIPNPKIDSPHNIQKKIIWNIFSQGLDQILIDLIVSPGAKEWSVTILQLIVIFYKDQQANDLHKLFNDWLYAFDAFISDSSEDNESNTSSPQRGLSPVPYHEYSENIDLSIKTFEGSSHQNGDEIINECLLEDTKNINIDEVNILKADNINNQKTQEYMATMHFDSEQKKESICLSTGSDDSTPAKKPKLHSQSEHSSEHLLNMNFSERKRQKIIKRESSNIINIKRLQKNLPTKSNISEIMKNFTIDFLLKGYNELIGTIYKSTLVSGGSEMDLTNLFWLLSYFLKFTTQIELKYKHVSKVISYDILSYLTTEVLNLYEKLEIATKRKSNDYDSILEKIHLGVSAIQEYIKALESFSKSSHDQDQKTLSDLITNICDNGEIHSLFVVLLRNYKPHYHTTQYLKDLIVTNHLVVSFVDKMSKSTDYHGTFNAVRHVQQFANNQMMFVYGVLLEHYQTNGNLVNDCIFTIMHHVAGSLKCLECLFQPNILRALVSILETQFHLCDDWIDLIDYITSSYIRKSLTIDKNKFDLKNTLEKKNSSGDLLTKLEVGNAIAHSSTRINNDSVDSWSEEELTLLSCTYIKNNTSSDVIGEIVKAFDDDGMTKTRSLIIEQLFVQNLINYNQYEDMLKGHKTINSTQSNKVEYDAKNLMEKMLKDGKAEHLDWLKNYLEKCYHIKLNFENILSQFNSSECNGNLPDNITIICSHKPVKQLYSLMTISSVAYYSFLLNQSVPIVPWNEKQASYCEDSTFLQLSAKLGFLMPVNSEKIFICLPSSWDSNAIIEVAHKIISNEKDVSTSK